MMGITGESLLYIWESGKRKNLYTYHNKVHFFMFYFTWEMHLCFCLKEISTFVRAPPSVLHFKKIRNGGQKGVRKDKNKDKRLLQ